MTIKKANSSLTDAKKAKEDEFYTELSDIERELRHYRQHFKGRVVYCNCDDPRASNFFHYFSYNFEIDLFSQNASECAIMLEYTGDKDGNRVPTLEEIGIVALQGDGDFRSEESIAILKEADIVVTNPPFSLFREYVAQLMHYDKKFLILGNHDGLIHNKSRLDAISPIVAALDHHARWRCVPLNSGRGDRRRLSLPPWRRSPPPV